MITSGSLALVAALTLSSAAVALPASEPGTYTIEYGGEKIDLAYDPALAIENDPNARKIAPKIIEVDPEEVASQGSIDWDSLDFDWSNFNETEGEPEPEFEDSAPGLKKRNQSVRNHDRGFPYSAIGKVLWDNGVWCSGALIGPRHMLTARHCIPGSGTIRFVPWWSDGATVYPGTTVSEVFVWPWRDGPDCPARDDWAVTVLANRIGDARGWFGMDTPQTRFLNRPWLTSCGYPGAKDNGRFMYCHHSVTLEHIGSQCGADGAIRTNAQVSGGQSGSAVYYTESPNRRIMGTLHGHAAGKSYFASGREMKETVSLIRGGWP